jgi:hypothetical protein
MKPGEVWGEACDAAPDIEVEGSDRNLALAVARHPGALVRFVPGPSSQLARAVGIRPDGELLRWAVPMDALCLDDGRVAVNMVVLGTPPERMRRFTRTFPLDREGGAKPVLCAVLANGQFRHNQDLVPRGHPGDGVAELHLYRVPKEQRAALRARLAHGTHLPHPDIEQRRVKEFKLRSLRPVRLELDTTPAGTTKSLTITLIPNAYRLLL